MMSDFEILHALIRDEALAEVEDRGGKKTMILTESGNGRQTYTIKVHGVPDDIIAMKADRFPPPNRIFKKSNGECKRADFIVVARTNGGNWIVFIEMKSGSSGEEKKIVQQLKGAQCFAAYCRAIGQVFWQAPGFLKERDYQQRFVSIKNIGMNKKPTRNSHPSRLHDKPENMLKISAPGNKRLQFRELINKS